MFCKVSCYWLESTQHFHPFGDISRQLGQVRLSKVMPTANKSCQDVPLWVHSTKEHPPQCPGPLYLDHDHHYNILQRPLAWNMKIWVWRMTHKITVGPSSLNLIFFFFFFHLILIDLAQEAMKLNSQENLIYFFYVMQFPRNKLIIQIAFLAWLHVISSQLRSQFKLHKLFPNMGILYDTVWEQKGPYTQRKTTFNTNKRGLSSLLRKVFFYSQKSLPKYGIILKYLLVLFL